MRSRAEPPRPERDREDDRALVERCTAEDSDGAAWDELVRRYQPLVASVARSTLDSMGAKDPALVDDTISEVFSDLLANRCRSLKTFSWRCSFAGWLAVVARRHARKTLRRAKPSLLRDEHEVVAHQASPLEESARREVRAIVQEELAKLTDRDRLALKLHYEDGCSYAEVAEVVGLPSAHVSSLLGRARAKLRTALERILR